MVLNGEYSTIDTPLATYLILRGCSHIDIRYTEQDFNNRKRQGTYYFQKTPELLKELSIYNRGEAIVNLALYERTKNNLLDRIMRGLP